LRAVVDHHVDRPEVEAGQPAQPTGTNRSIGFERPHPAARTNPDLLNISNLSSESRRRQTPPQAAEPAFRQDTHKPGHTHNSLRSGAGSRSQEPPDTCLLVLIPGRLARPGGHSEGQNTRSHPELGRENPQRQWYCASRRGRVGRRQALQTLPTHTSPGPQARGPKPTYQTTRGGAAR
jgi:hypothetical protein